MEVTCEQNQESAMEHTQCGLMLNEFNDLRMEKELCDVTLCVEDKRFPLHRAVLAANSPYFRAMFTNGMAETQRKEIELKHIDADTFSTIVQFIYTRNAPITTENVASLLTISDCFSISGLMEACIEFMKSSICSENCLSVLRFAKMYYKTELEECAHKFIADNFWKLSSDHFPSKEYLKLNQEELYALLEDDNLNVINEQEAFEAAEKWAKSRPRERRKCMPHILSRLRLGHLTNEYFEEKVAKHTYCGNDACRKVLAPMWNLMKKERILQNATGKVHHFMKPRVPRGVVFAIGGWSGGTPIPRMETYDCNADMWFDFKDLEDSSPRAYHGLVAMDGLIYMIGGFNGSEYYNSVRVFNPKVKAWKEVSPMYTPRCYVSTAALDEFIYACGGYDGRWRLSTVERFHPQTNQWTKVASMNMKRSDAGIDSMQGKLFIAGGFNGDTCLRTAEVYDPASDQWTYIRAMETQRSGVAVAAYEGCLYAVGGFDGEVRLSSAERYDPITSRWCSIPNMSSRRSNCAAVVLGDMLLAIGGFNGTVTISETECYDEETDKWYHVADMAINRSALKAVVLMNEPHMRDYTYLGQRYDTYQDDSPMDQDENLHAGNTNEGDHEKAMEDD